MLNCQKVSFLLSQSLDTPLPWIMRARLGLHLLMCRRCAAFRRQILVLTSVVRGAAAALAVDPGHDTAALSPAARARIKELLASQGAA
ncbi:MAG: zf-HC2 domain-containing protein [Chitinivibrionales bacterium]|nr:zf-HC2 domain-containing protein [Chitinivibrionales bacterium]MBD3395739.1 zf-HC2 domain-containing protein [Chitinivibrionales bacterium]